MPRQLTKTIICFLLLLLLIAIYGQIRHHDYIHYDDHLIMVDNPILTRSLSPANIYRAFIDQPEHVPYKIPLTIITNMARWHFFGDDIGLHHLLSLFFHALTVILVFFLMEGATGKLPQSGPAAGLVAVHPLNVEAVCWLGNINTIMADFFLMATLLAYVHYTKKPDLKRYLLLFIPFVLGLMGKPTLVVGPLLMLTLDYWPLKRFQRQTGPQDTADDSPPPAGLIKQLAEKTGRMFLLIEKLPFLLIALAPYLLELLSNPDKLIAGVGAGGGVHPQGLPYIFWPLLKTVAPTNLTIGRAYPAAGSLVEAGFFLLLLALVTGAVLWLSRRWPWIGFGWLWYLAAILPVIVMMIGSGRPMADRHAYLPLAGIFMAVSYLAGDVLGKKPYGRTVFVILAALVLGILTALSFGQVRHWQNSRTIFEHAVRINPDNPRARVNLGDVYLRAGQIDRPVNRRHPG
ncbi:MAG: tetratricopeptide repeat protein [Desulfosudaceae bacterium]